MLSVFSGCCFSGSSACGAFASAPIRSLNCSVYATGISRGSYIPNMPTIPGNIISYGENTDPKSVTSVGTGMLVSPIVASLIVMVELVATFVARPPASAPSAPDAPTPIALLSASFFEYPAFIASLYAVDALVLTPAVTAPRPKAVAKPGFPVARLIVAAMPNPDVMAGPQFRLSAKNSLMPCGLPWAFCSLRHLKP